MNKLWFKAIIGECALNFKTGLTHSRAGSPWTQFRKVFPDCPRNKKKGMKFIKDLLTYNRIEHKYFDKIYNEMEKEGL